MTAVEIMAELERLGDPQTKATLMKHGAKEPFFGVKVADLKTILKKTKKNHELSLELYETGNSDAMYLAGLMADEKKITEEQLDKWLDKAYWYYLNEFTVPWVAGETAQGFKIGMRWLNSKEERVASAGWNTLAYYAAMNEDSKLDIKTYEDLLDRAVIEVSTAPNRTKYCINGFVIAIGTYISELTPKALAVAAQIGKVDVILAGASCKVPLAKEYIDKNVQSGRIGKKRKTARC